MKVTLWHNPRCTKSREGLEYLRGRGIEPEIRLYLRDAPSLDELVALQHMLDLPFREFTRKGEMEFSAAGLAETSSEQAILNAMAEFPRLIERPIAIADGRAIVGRPAERFEKLFQI